MCCGWKGRELHAGFWWGTEEIIDGRIILKRILKK
jgi:hypothetical protein